ncbi:cytochrome C oxidase Cbb3 [Bordetella sp. H567]|uniref:c-type cytochrome n=1 Tax=Bordetella sp. H567 TaxID=1697043 RepID=UPI00081C9795|nr:cytochrome c [Bordetella sp. H567]AOB30235.1 cytochrome C oxidase Cbb3 [Bordetella sp. H567]
MSPDSKPSSASQTREHADPSERVRPIPRLAAAVTLGVVVAGVAYVLFSDPFGNPQLGDRRTVADLIPRAEAAGAPAAADGKALFTANCAACHQAAGTGVPGVFPPLDGSEWVKADSRVAINILLHGLQGEIKVKDTVYNGSMPSFGGKFSDNEVAAVATYIRSQWSNSADAVTAGQVAAERKAVTRTTPFAGGAELQALTGKP